jgi:bifunctional enzyme CysN/CysC
VSDWNSCVPVRQSSVIGAEIDGELVLLDTASGALHVLNPVAAAVWGELDGVRPVEAIVADLSVETGEDVARVGADVTDFLERLANTGLLSGGTPAIGRESRSSSLRQQPAVIWLTGIPGAGKSTLANELELELQRRGRHTYLLDGDRLRRGLNADLGFSEADRLENVRRVAEVARLMADAGLIVIVALISPYRASRAAARARFEPGEFIEVFVDTPREIAEQRDPKGLYGRARRGELRDFTSIDSPYEPPDAPELRIDTTQLPAQEAARQVLELLDRG